MGIRDSGSSSFVVKYLSKLAEKLELFEYLVTKLEFGNQNMPWRLVTSAKADGQQRSVVHLIPKLQLGNPLFRKLQLRGEISIKLAEKLELFEYLVTKLEFGNQNMP